VAWPGSFTTASGCITNSPKPGDGNGGMNTATVVRARGPWTVTAAPCAVFEPHVAEAVFEDLTREHQSPVFRNEWLDRRHGVPKEGNRIVRIRMLSGRTFEARIFLDATYEGDLMAAAGVDYAVGREGRDVYGEIWAGVQTGLFHHRHHFKFLRRPISAYRVPGDPDSGLLPQVSCEPRVRKAPVTGVCRLTVTACV